MKKTSRIFLALIILVIVLFAAVPMLEHSHLGQSSKTTEIKPKKHKTKKKKLKPATWGYPFKRMEHKKIKFESGQEFGKTDIIRRYKPKSYFHDGWDFGFSEVGHSPVYAVHAGTVHKVKYRAGMGLYVWVISPDGYVEVYQEGFLNDFDIYVKKGQKIKLGQKIGKLTGSHIHLGITRINKHYIDKHGDPCGNWWKDNGTWLNPMQIINKNLGAKANQID